jgi:hypothetical protein
VSKIAMFAHIVTSDGCTNARKALTTARRDLEAFAKDSQKDGADSEVLVRSFKAIDRALAALD